MDKHDLLRRIMMLVPMVLSLTVHEWAHAWSAYQLGDDTAERQGRLTLNPLAHIDPLGTLLLPMLGIPFGWARPVPINPLRFRRAVSMRTGIALTAAAGPLSNFALSLLSALGYGLFLRFSDPASSIERSAAGLLFSSMILVNVVLGVFNLLPLPPLDGGRIVDGIVPARLEAYWDKVRRVSPVLLLVVLLAPGMGGFSLIRWPVEHLGNAAHWVVALVAGWGTG